MFLKFFTTTIFCILLVFTASAQTGKVIGKIVDQETGEPLVGANVLIVSTTLGAASDVDGRYIILNVPVGKYSVKASYIGYRNVVIQNIEVITGLSTEVNFKLPTQSLKTGEIVIISKRPLVNKSATNAIRIVNAEDLETLPVREIGAVIALQAGVVTQNGRTFIRGSRADETGYLLEGIDVKNVVSRNGGNLVTVIPDALQELNVQAGGYNAEYGNANAGIISQNFKSGSNKYKVSLRMETDNFGNYPGEKFLGTYSYGYTDYTATFGGPIIKNKLTVFLAGENRFVRDYSPRFFSPNPQTFADGARFDATKIHDSGALGGDTSDAQILTWLGGNIPGRMRNVYSLNGNVTLNLNPLILRVNGAFSTSRSRNNSSTIINIFDLDRLGISDRSNLFLNLKATYVISSNTFVVANVNYLDNRAKTYDQDLGDDYLSYSDSLIAAKHGWTNFRNLTSGPVSYDFYGFPFSRPGALLTGYGKSKWQNFGGNFDFTTQYKKHEIKAGATYQRWTIRNYGVGGSSTLLNSILNNPDFARNTNSLKLFLQSFNMRSFGGVYGYDLFGSESNSGPFGAKHPVFASAYVQDKFEFNDLVINAGVRFDSFDMDSWELIYPDNPQYNLNTKLIDNSQIRKSKSYQYVSPKLGFAFPVSDRTVFHLQYGKYVQSPGLDVAYKGILYSTRVLIGGNAFGDPVAYDPKPVRTTQYEIGFTQQFSDFASFDVTAFYKDIKGQLQYEFHNTIAGASVSTYPVYTNQDFATTKGLEFTLTLRRVNRIRANLNYTYSNAQGTNSFSTSGFGSVQVNNNVPTVIQALAYDQTHRGAVTLDYRFGKGDGGPILEQLGIDLLFSFHSGHPFTLAQETGLGQSSAWTGGLIGTDTRQRRPDGPINSTTTTWVYRLDLRIDKTVSISNFNVNFYVYVQNLLNTQNVINVYDKTGNAYDDGFLSSKDAKTILASPRYTKRFADLYRALNLANREHAFQVKGVDMFGTPRQIRAGILINF